MNQCAGLLRCAAHGDGMDAGGRATQGAVARCASAASTGCARALDLHEPLDHNVRCADASALDRSGNFHRPARSEEHTSELQSLMRISYAVFCLKKQTNHTRV